MPQVDLETLVCGGGGGGGDGRVACETVISGAPPDRAQKADDPDFPPESYEVAIGDEIDWVDLNAVYERDDSTKGITNPKSHNATTGGDRRMSNSQRFSGNLKPKAPIIALPNKLQHSGYLGHSARRPPNGRIFPKKGGKATAGEREPGSPKVSCFGKVLSERERERCRIQRREAPETPRRKGRGFWAAFFCCASGDRGEAERAEVEQSSASFVNIPAAKRRPSAATAAEAPGLGGMKRFASGRRSSSWGGDEDGHVAWSGPFDEDGFRIRRSAASLEDLRPEADS